ncbi:hypothetical protein [Pararhizobium mangrovi]|uniref:Uncharacterized protein n=1 Tax=Pararhizobium mangrovi TaxID=2590452 RepID=A0A506UEA1_9HYPH|nr:hypothetical protein [Pararhizobium mangrovi]TPW31185.1 hypothetical protein FJU11_03015 [Pararhizobium mangrovi]
MVDAPLRLDWRHTWPDVPRNYIAMDRENCFSVSVCWVFEPTGNPGREPWEWHANHVVGSDTRISPRIGQDRGYAATKGEAARLAEAAHFRMLDAVDALGWRDKLVEADEHATAARAAHAAWAEKRGFSLRDD